MAIQEIFEKVELKNLIILNISKYHPESVNQLVGLMRKRVMVSDKEIVNCLIELQNENKIVLAQIAQVSSKDSRKILVFKDDFRHWASLVLVLLALNGFIAFSSSFSFLIYFRYIIGFILVLFIPGFAFLRLFFGSKSAINGNIKMDYVEVFGLSIGLSMVLVPMVGLALNYTPWGITFESLVVSLFFVTTVLITGVVLRDWVEIRAKQMAML